MTQKGAWLKKSARALRSLHPPSPQERRRSEIEDKVAKTEEIKKEEAETERRELFNQQRTQRSKVATIARQMDMVNSVSYVQYVCTARGGTTCVPINVPIKAFQRFLLSLLPHF